MTEHERGRVRVEPGSKRVRAYLGGQPVADTNRPKLVWETPYYPAYYIPRDDVRDEFLIPSPTTSHSPSRGDAPYFHVTVGSAVSEDGAWQDADSPLGQLRGLIPPDWEATDAWAE